MNKIYLDYAAATPMSKEVLEAMESFFSEQFYNPSATYLDGRAARQAMNDTRASVAASLGCRPAEVIFTAGATEANNLAIQGIMKNYPNGNVLVSAIEHESVLAPAELFNCRQIPVNAQGIVELKALQDLIDEQTVLVSVMQVNNELGTIQPLSDIAQLLNKLRILRAEKDNKMPLYLHSDAAQAGNYLDLHVSRLGVDLLSLNGGKIYGPKQSGALYVRAGIKIQPLIVGGGQEFGLRSGTENVAASAGLAAALKAAQNKRRAEAERILKLRQGLETELLDRFKTAAINGGKHRAPHITNVTFAGVDNERLMMQLDELGIAGAVGSACSASSDEPSHVLAAIGLSELETRASLRFSFGRNTTEAELKELIRALGLTLASIT